MCVSSSSRWRGAPVHLAVESFRARSDAEGRFQGVLIVMEDLTPLIRAQRTAAWREVARRIAHEIKNPLTPIQLSAQRILKKFNEGAPGVSTYRGGRRHHHRQGSHDSPVPRGRLQPLRAHARRFARPLRPDAVVDTALSAVRWDAPRHPLPQGRRKTASERCDWTRTRVKRALTNLIDNAIAAMEGSGTITATDTGRSETRQSCGSRSRTTGRESLPRTRSVSSSPYFSTKKRGTGLGLAIVNRIVSDHNGFIRVEDNPPSGTRFVIDLPA